METSATAGKQLIVTYLFAQAFATSRDLRSEAYKDGVLAALSKHVLGADVRCQFAQGSAEFDAFFAGTTEGHAIGRQYLAGEIAIPAGEELAREVAQLREKMEMQALPRRASRVR